jgi:malonyl-CoA/methylmalonyl-CoA synthetase
LPNVEESAVVGIPHADFGEGVTAFVVCKPGSNVTEKEILDSLSGRLARFKHPKRVVFLEQLPRNSLGKVQKSLMRETYNNLYG